MFFFPSFWRGIKGVLSHFPSKVFDPSKVSCLSHLLFCFVPILALIDQNMTTELTSCVQCHELEWFKYDNNEKIFTNYSSLNDMLGLSLMGPPWWALSTFEGKARGPGPNLKGPFMLNPGAIWASGPDGTRIELKGTFKVWSWVRFLGTSPLKR